MPPAKQGALEAQLFCARQADRAAEAGHAEGALQAGLMFAAGEGAPPDLDRAMALIRQSAELT